MKESHVEKARSALLKKTLLGYRASGTEERDLSRSADAKVGNIKTGKALRSTDTKVGAIKPPPVMTRTVR